MSTAVDVEYDEHDEDEPDCSTHGGRDDDCLAEVCAIADVAMVNYTFPKYNITAYLPLSKEAEVVLLYWLAADEVPEPEMALGTTEGCVTAVTDVGFVLYSAQTQRSYRTLKYTHMDCVFTSPAVASWLPDWFGSIGSPVLGSTEVLVSLEVVGVVSVEVESKGMLLLGSDMEGVESSQENKEK